MQERGGDPACWAHLFPSYFGIDSDVEPATEAEHANFEIPMSEAVASPSTANKASESSDRQLHVFDD